MKFEIGDKIVPKYGMTYPSWTCGKAKDRSADYAVITRVSDYYTFDLYKDGKKVGWCTKCQNDTNSKLMEKTMEDLQKGDVIVGRTGTERTVIERLGDIVFTTDRDNDWNNTCMYNTTTLKINGLTLKQTEPTELTMQEVADKFGVDVSKLKIKEG